MFISKTRTGQRSHPLVLARLQQEAERRKRYNSQIPKWRRPAVGYVLSAALVGLGLLGAQLEQLIIHGSYFPALPLILPVLIAALIWGTGPAMLAVPLGTLALDYFYFPPVGTFGLNSWDGLLRILPFVVSGIIVAVIAGQREVARRRALFAEQEVREHALELEQVNRELEQANELKDRFLSMASHELRTPITSIRGQAQIILRRLSRQAELPEGLASIQTALQKIDEQTHRLSSLVDDLTDLSSIRAGKLELRLGDCNLVDICQHVVGDQRLISGRAIELEFPAEAVMLRADCNRLSQVILNLVSNAIKYSPEDRPVEVGISSHDDVAVVRICDAGPGIPKDQQDRIFEMFYRDPRAEESSQNGLGIGLAICKDIVERHGGRIWCDSLVDNGSTFIVELPLR
jgi:signal transduction histidine kinase